MSYVRVDNLVIYQGDDRPFSWPLRDADGQALNLQGYTARAQVRPRPDSSRVLHEWSVANNNIDTRDGSITLYVVDSETWDWDHGVYDLHLVDSDGNTEVIAHGTVDVTAGVTR